MHLTLPLYHIEIVSDRDSTSANRNVILTPPIFSKDNCILHMLNTWTKILQNMVEMNYFSFLLKF